MSQHVEIVEVGPRDGLQAWPKPIATSARIGLVERLREAGARRIEVGAFVAPDRVPRMADTADVMAAAAEGGYVEAMQWLRDRGTDWNVHVPNAAAHEGNLEALKWLADKGCPLDLEGAITACCLGEKESWNNTFEACVWLIETYAPETGWHYFETACECGCRDVIEWLEERYPKECHERF